jgi:hypothetical protein
MPTLSVSVAPGTHVCQGNTVMFTSTTTFGGASPLIKWNKNGINVATGPSYFYLPANGDIVYAQLNSNYTCRLADSVVSPATVMNVETPAPAPTVSVIANPGLNIGVGQTDTFIAVAAGGTSSLTYQWMINAVPVPGATSALFIIDSLDNGDVVTAKVTNIDFCALSTSKTVTVNVSNVGIEGVWAEEAYLSLAPNPNNGTFHLSGVFNGALEADVQVSNLLGQILYSQHLAIRNGILDEQLAVNSLVPGMYVLSVRTAVNNNTVRFSVAK